MQAKRLYALAAIAILWAAPLWADPPKLVIPPEVRPAGQYVRVVPETDGVSVVYVGLSGVDGFPSDELKDPRRFLLDTRGLPAGRYRFAAVAASKTGEQARADFVVVVGDVPPSPTPPGPVPPGPTPPGPAPIPGDGLRVLIVYETADIASLPRGQQAALQSGDVRAYMNAKCAKGPDGKTAEWRIWDKDVDLKNEAKSWQDAMARKRDKLPWLVISTGKGGYEGPLPDTAEKTLELLKQFGG